ncbi:MAG: hypothetical protein Roseis2KO_34290 [Roseivirga sp.]
MGFSSTAQTSASFTDARDGQVYQTVSWEMTMTEDSTKTMTWMAENLKFNIEGSSCFNDDEANCENYGRLYNFFAAMEACPVGWSLPSNHQWQQLVDQFGGLEKAGKMLKSKSRLWKGSKPKLEDAYLGGTRYAGNNRSGFDILPTGVGTSETGFYKFGLSAVFWSSSSETASTAWDWIFSVSSSRVINSTGDKKSTGNAVRCIKDE